MTVWQLERRISKQLLIWSGSSIVLGSLLMFGTAFWRGVGLQCIVWGIIDAAIAFFGQRNAKRKQAVIAASKELRSLRRILLINAGLDIAYIGIGIGLIMFQSNAFGRGNGLGIFVQGSFLLGFDLWHGLRSTRHVFTEC